MIFGNWTLRFHKRDNCSMPFSDDEIRQAGKDPKAAEALLKGCRPIFEGVIAQYDLKGNATKEAIAFIEKGIRRDNDLVFQKFNLSKGTFETYIIVIARSLLYAYFLQSGILPEKFRKTIELEIKKGLPEFQDPTVSKMGEDLDSIYNKVLHKLMGFKGCGSFHPYLEKAIRFVRGDYLRKMATEPDIIPSGGSFQSDEDGESKANALENFPDPQGEPSESLERTERSRELLMRIQSLEPDVRLALFLRYFFGYAPSKMVALKERDIKTVCEGLKEEYDMTVSKEEIQRLQAYGKKRIYKLLEKGLRQLREGI